MLVGAVDLILILVTLLAVTVGTIWNPSMRTKETIIGLAIVTSIGTAIKTTNSARENEINARLISTLVQASQPPEHFPDELVRAIGPLFKKLDVSH